MKSKAERFEAFIAPYERSVYFTCLRVLSHKQDAEDCAQEALLRAYKYFDSFKNKSKPTTWLYRIAYNCCMDYIKAKDNTISFEDLEGENIEDDGPSLYLQLEESERKRLLKEALKELPAMRRVPIVLCDLQGLSYQEAADIMDIPLGTLKSRINRARNSLKKILLENRELFLQNGSLIDEGGKNDDL
ncbi:MAG: RNA polymerase sigma factor [Eubacteriales bacterium]|nr:RNA polymerase sigma factor [Eubacteriales bacterium]